MNQNIKKKNPIRLVLVTGISALITFSAQAEFLLEEIVVTGVKMREALTVETDPKAPRQPLPAHDGADYLKTIPGFSIIRKGGTDGDPVLRGMAGSRLSLLIDGESILGGCSNRMDPPTAYVFPETFDSIKVIKGPQSVQYGPGNSAGVVLFERDRDRMEQAGWKVNGSALAGSFGRADGVVDVTAGTPEFYVRGAGTYARQGNYNDGDGTEIHSRYERWSAQFSGGWTPDDNTTVELSGALSDGEAAYADREVDGAKFGRTNIGLKFIKENLGTVWRKLETQVYYNYVDHVMDTYSLRESGTARAMNPDRKTVGGRLTATFDISPDIELVAGFDGQNNEHTNRMTMNQNMVSYLDLPREGDASFRQLGLFSELTYAFEPRQRLIGGLRLDNWRAHDERENIMLTMMMGVPNPTADEVRKNTLTSGFARYERDMSSIPATFYAGIGHNQRFPDYWEMIGKETLDSVNAFDIDSEKTTQLDVGLIYNSDHFNGGVSLFYNEIDDFLLIQRGILKPAGMMGTRDATITRNIEAQTWGLEVDATYALTTNWVANATLASVRGSNKTDDTPLAQIPPLEVRLGLNYNSETWSVGTLWRLVDSQGRVDINKGNIVGQDIGPTDGFNVVSINAGWRPTSEWLVSAGVDNVFDTTYAEHISRSGATIPGFDQVTRINEPGRTYWLKAQLAFN
ncbi:MAG: TonB-dependent copper receptor [Gammaproteobacteria bacterium]